MAYTGQNYGYTDRATNESVRRRRQADLNDVRNINQVITNFANFSMRQLVLGAVAKANAGELEQIKIFAELTRGSITRNYEGRIKAVHDEVGQHALDVMQAAYFNRPDKRRVGSYRADDINPRDGRPYRDSNKALYNALGDKRMFRVARDGIDFLDPVFLDSRARQWYRLNFGAGAAGGHTKKGHTARMNLFGKRVGEISLNNFGPSGSFRIPGGFWTNGGRLERWKTGANTGQFFMAPPPWGGNPYGERAIGQAKQAGSRTHVSRLDAVIRSHSTATRGIRGSRFLDEGVYTLAKELPLAYAKLYKEWFDTYQRTNRGPVASRRIQELTTSSNINTMAATATSEEKRLNAQRRLQNSTGSRRSRNQSYARRHFN